MIRLPIHGYLIQLKRGSGCPSANFRSGWAINNVIVTYVTHMLSFTSGLPYWLLPAANPLFRTDDRSVVQVALLPTTQPSPLPLPTPHRNQSGTIWINQRMKPGLERKSWKRPLKVVENAGQEPAEGWAGQGEVKGEHVVGKRVSVRPSVRLSLRREKEHRLQT